MAAAGGGGGGGGDDPRQGRDWYGYWRKGNPNDQLQEVKLVKKEKPTLPTGADLEEGEFLELPDSNTGDQNLDKSMTSLVDRINCIMFTRISILLKLGKSGGKGAVAQMRKMQIADEIRDVVNAGKGANFTYQELKKELRKMQGHPHHMPFAFPPHLLKEPQLNSAATSSKGSRK